MLPGQVTLRVSCQQTERAALLRIEVQVLGHGTLKDDVLDSSSGAGMCTCMDV